MRYFFTTSRLRAPIDPVTPIDAEKLVDTDTSIIIDSLEILTSVLFDGTIVWNGAFQNGWSGVSFAIEGGYRLVCDPPAALTQDTSYQVTAASATHNLVYNFAVGLIKVTTTNDTTAPRITEATSSYAWISYVRNNESGLPLGEEQGNLYLRKALPTLTGEVRILPAEDSEVGYDPISGKVYIFYTRIGKVFSMTADPADLPSTQSQVRSILDDVQERLAGESNYKSETIVSYAPVKQLVTDTLEEVLAGPSSYSEMIFNNFYVFKRALSDSASIRLGSASNYEQANVGPWKYIPTPEVALGMNESNYTVVRVARPTEESERTLIQGVQLIKWSTGGAHRTVRFIPFQPVGKLFVYMELQTTDRLFGVENVYRSGGTDGENDPIAVGPTLDSRLARKNKGSGDAFFYFEVLDTDFKGRNFVRIVASVFNDLAFAVDPVTISLEYTNIYAANSGDTSNVYYSHPVVHVLRGAGSWATVEWIIEDAGFRSFQNGDADFRLNIGTKRVCVSRVDVVCSPTLLNIVDYPIESGTQYSVISVFKESEFSERLVYSEDFATYGVVSAIPKIGEYVKQRFAGNSNYYGITTTGYDPIGP